MSKFIIYAGKEFKADFTVVSSDGVTGEELDATDTAFFSMVTSGVNKECVLDNIPMTIIDADNGVFELTLTAEQTSLLSEYLGFQEDGYSTIGNYNGYLEFTLVSGNRQATIVIDVQEVPSCPIV